MLVAALLLLVPAAARGADRVELALERADVYASPAQLGPEAARARRELAIVAAELTTASRPVKLAIVPGRGGTPALLSYARRLRGALDFDGTVVLTTPGGAVAVAGPRAPAELTLRLRRARVGRIADPVDRLISAAEVTAVERRGTSGTREVAILIGLAVLGGSWAVAAGAGRRARRGRQQLAEQRAAMRVHLDVLRARASALARGGRLPEGVRPRVQAALGTYADSIAALQQASSADEVALLGPSVAAGLDALSAAGREAGEPWASEADPFAGLCGADPAHGPPEGEGPATAGGPSVPLCARCCEALERGDPVPLRMVPAEGRPVPFTETAGLLRRGGAG